MPLKNIQRSIDEANAEFWNELCGSGLAKQIGITDHSVESLAQFDKAYMGFYPYLLDHVKIQQMRGKKVLDIGLGYGTLGQIIAEAGTDYTGLDIAEGPVKMMNHRLAMLDLSGRAIQGSMLDCPIDSESMDWVVSIGCFHHTGNMQRCVDETYRILKPGGRAMIMVYNRFSLRQWQQWPKKTFQAFLHDLGILSQPKTFDEQRKAYDASETGMPAPETEFFSKRQVQHIFKDFSKVICHKENCDNLLLSIPFKKNQVLIPRMRILQTLGKILGLDLYIEVIK